MMNSKRAQSFMDPLPQGKRARLEGTVGTVSTSGLSKANSLPQYSQDKSLPYRHTYMSCGQETLDLPSQWSPSRMFVRSRGSPVVHASATEGSITNTIIYGPESVNFPGNNGSPTVPEDVVAKQKLVYSSRSPRKHSPSSAGLLSPVPFRKIPLGCRSLSPAPAEKSGGLAIPKPVYGHSPCCAGQKCTVGQSYTMDQGLQRMPRKMFEDDQMMYYSHWTCMQKKESEALLQQRLLAYDHCGERHPLKEVTSEDYHGLSPVKPQRVSAFSDPCQNNYLYNHVHPFVPSSPDCQRFQMPRQSHKDLVPMYETVPGMQYGTHMQIYQDCPLTSKYREIPQHPLLYCQKNNIDVYRPENFQQTSGQHPILQPFIRDYKHHYPVVLPGHPAVRNVPAYPAYRTHLNTRQMNPLGKRQFCSSVMQQVEQPLDFSMRQGQNADSNQEQALQGQLGNKGNFHQTDPQAHYMVSDDLHLANLPKVSPCQGQQGQDNCLLKSRSYTNTPTCTEDILKKNQSLHFTHKPSNDAVISKKRRVETDKSCENNSLVKPQMMQQLKANEINPPSSPPMPVINKVFSLAPYKAYLEATGLLSPTQDPSCSNLQPDLKPPKDESEAQNPDPQTNLDKDVIKLKIKTEKLEPDERVCQSEKESHSPVISQNNHNAHFKEEKIKESTEWNNKHNLVMKSDFYSGSKPVTEVTPEHPLECTTAYGVIDRVVVPMQNTDQKNDFPASLCGNPPIQSPINQATFSLNKIPPHCLKLTSFKIVLPEVFKTPLSPVPDIVMPPVENKVAVSSKQARYQFMELHHSLCRLVSRCISQTSHCDLKNWLSGLDLEESSSPQNKTIKISCLLGSKIRVVWMKDEEMVRAFQKVLYQLDNYVRIQECPFPHVIRAGAVFIPMLVVKEVLFPHVQGTFIDQVLQEHRVELRPTTLTEERQLTQLHKRAFSSKLRRLLSLKHLPVIYPDVLNLHYYDGVCKFLEVNSTLKKECVQRSDEAESTFNEFEVHCVSPRPHVPDTTTCLENLKPFSYQKNSRKKGRVKGACKRRFLGDDTSSEEDRPAEESESWTFTGCLEMEGWENVTEASAGVEAHTEVKIESDIDQEPEENSWGRPLTSDDLLSESSDMDTEISSLSSYASHAPGSVTKRSDMVLKLRKVYHTKGQRGQVSHYQRVPNQSEVQRGRHRHGHKKKKPRTSLRHRVRKFSSRSQDCSHHSAPGTSEHRKRWVLRSTTQNTHQTMRNRYPDLVGKRIRHLYEENDKTEVWYKGVVLRIHESHPNPLKTVFEVKYDSEPEWQYYLELLMDYKKGWLQIED